LKTSILNLRYQPVPFYMPYKTRTAQHTNRWGFSVGCWSDLGMISYRPLILWPSYVSPTVQQNHCRCFSFILRKKTLMKLRAIGLHEDLTCLPSIISITVQW
jgi:hypothetical protein